ncbi:hypothetical protein SEUCBS139899_002498 [Sporothrix eucalyptigena]|uniref:Uncharacterized protein n=1 Tax=Sporothrix eucalyptigena TaxID=1812306 RepID=A0ABP0B4S1_9PEZI
MPSTNYNYTSRDHQDFRGGNQEQQRFTNDVQKWTRYRCRPLIENIHDHPDIQNGVPVKTVLRGRGFHSHWSPPKFSNVNKINRASFWDMPKNRLRTSYEAHNELQEANSMSASVLVSTSTYTPPTSINVAANGATLDGGDAPLRSLPLSAFIKQPSVRDTEKMATREYEIVDHNGSTATGRRARDLLRQTPTSIPNTDSGFELI